MRTTALPDSFICFISAAVSALEVRKALDVLVRKWIGNRPNRPWGAEAMLQLRAALLRNARK